MALEPGGAFEVALYDKDFFTNASNDDLKIRTILPNQKIHIGTASNQQSAMMITSNTIIMNNNLYIYEKLGVGKSNLDIYPVDIVGNTAIDGSVNTTKYVLCRGMQLRRKTGSYYAPSELPTGVLQGFSNEDNGINLYIGASSVDNYFRFTAAGNEIMRLTADGILRVKETIPYGDSNTRNFNDILYISASNKSIGINTSNPSVTLDISATDAIQLPSGTTPQRPQAPRQGFIRYNTTTETFEGFASGNTWGSLGGVKDTNQDTFIAAETFPTSNDDTLRFINSNRETMRIAKNGMVGIGTSNPSELVDIQSLGNLKVANNVFAMNRFAIGHSNPLESLDILSGNIKGPSNIYALASLSVAHSNPTEALDIRGNIKASSNVYVINRLSVGTSNPKEQFDIIGNIKASSNIYALNSLGVGTSNPTVTLEVSGNAKISNNLEVLGNLTIQGTTTTINATTVSIADNMIRINNGANYTSSLQAGIEVNRGGGYCNYMFLFDESSQYFKVGQQGPGLQTVATRDDTLISHGLPIFDSIDKKFTSCNALTFSNNVLNIQGSVMNTPIINGNAFLGLNASLGVSDFLHIGLGQSTTYSNAAVVKYTHNGLNNARNQAQFGLWGFNHITCSANSNVGINSISPSNALDVSGWIRAFGGSANTSIISANSNATGFSCFQCQGDFDGGLVMFQNGSARLADGGTHTATIRNDIGDLRLQAMNASVYIKASNCNVGIDAPSPSERLHVGTGKILASSGQILGCTGDTAAVPAYSWGDNSNTGMYHPANNTIAFTNDGSETVRIASQGNVGIGTTSPLGTLHMINRNTPSSCNPIIIEAASFADGTSQGQSTINFNGYVNSTRTRVNSTKNHWRISVNQNANNDTFQVDTWNGSNTINPFTISSNGNVGIRTVAPSYALEVTGQIFASDDIFAFSDGRYKNDLCRIESALDKVDMMNGYYYRLEGTAKRSVGLVAQEVQKVIPEVVTYDDSHDRFGVNYGSIVAVLIEAIKELRVDVAAIKSQISTLI